jgi:excisionase family DNA binding protein
MEIQKLNHSPIEAGEIIDCSVQTIYKYIAEGRLKPIKQGRNTKIPHSELTRLQAELASRPFVLADVSAAVAARQRARELEREKKRSA